MSTPRLFSNKKGTIVFEKVVDRVQEALRAFDDYTVPGRQGYLPDDDLEIELQNNPHLIIPYVAEEDYESEFTIHMKKCRKPRVTKAQ